MKPDNASQLLNQLRPFLRDQQTFGKLYADVHDLVEMCTWFLQIMDSASGKQLDRDQIEDLLIEIDVKLVDHGLFHLKSLKKEIKETLEQISQKSDSEKDLRGVA